MPTIRLVILSLALALSLPAVSIGTLDTFTDGTTMGWHVPGASPVPPVNVATGGPAGAGDAFLQLTSLGNSAPGGRLSALSGPQWAGNYIAEGISLIRMDVQNFGPDDLFLRLLIEAFPDQVGQPPTDVALTANGVSVPAGSGWQTIYFDVSLGNLISAGLGTPEGALANADLFRIFHNPQAAFPGPMVGIPPVNAVLGVDNIQATVPEPGGFALLIGALVVGVFARHAGERGNQAAVKFSHPSTVLLRTRRGFFALLDTSARKRY